MKMAAKNSKESKGGRKGCPGAAAEPLFPRLHVNEGEKKGPRPPPRNKMALYEQLTVPSHRSVPQSVPSTAQGSGYEGRYSFCPFYFGSMPDSSAADAGYQVYNQSASGVTGGSAAVECTAQFPRVSATVSSAAMGSTYVSYTSNSQRNLQGKNDRDEDDCRVPQCSSSMTSSISTMEQCAMNNCHPKEKCTRNQTRPSPFTPNTFQHEKANIPSSSYSDSQKKCMQAESKDWSQIKDHLKRPIHLSDSFNASNDCNVSIQQADNSSNFGQVMTSGQHTIREEHLIATEDNADSTSEGLLLPDHHMHREDLVNVNVDDNGENADGSRHRDDDDPVSSLRNSYESSAGAECFSDENAAEISVPSQPQPVQENGFEDDSDSSMVDFVSFSNITPDVVIEAIGKPHFWKARKAILRQQRIFSVQVFELHRLMKVQKLMATSPILLNDDKSFVDDPIGKTGNENMSSDNVAELETGNDGTQTNEQLSTNSGDTAIGQLPEPEAVYHDSFNQGPGTTMHCGENGNMYVGSFPSIPMMAPGGMNAWGFPHPGFGLGQWTIPMPSPSGGFMFKPFAGAFPPTVFTSSTFGASGSSSFPPFVGASQGTLSELGYGLPASNMQWGSPAFSFPLGASNFIPNCYGHPFSMVDPMHKIHANVAPSVSAHDGTACEEAVPISSGHVTHGIPTSCSVALSRKQMGSTLTKQSAFHDRTRSGTHCNQAPRRFHTPPQNLSNVPDETRTCHDQIKGKSWQLSESGECSGTNGLRGEEGKVQERLADDLSEKASKTHQEEEICTNKAACQCKMTQKKDTLTLFPLVPSLGGRENTYIVGEHPSRVIKVVPGNPVSAPETAAGILLSIQQERQKVNDQLTRM